MDMQGANEGAKPHRAATSPAEPRCLAGAFIVNREEDMAPVLSILVGKELRRRGLHATEALCVQRAVHQDEGGSLQLLLSMYIPLG